MSEWKSIQIKNAIISANTGLDAIKRAPIVEHNTGIKCLRIQDISQEKAFDDWGFCEVDEKNYAKFQLKRNDIIIARTGASIGVNKYICNDLTSVFNNGLIRLRTNIDICVPIYLYYNFRTPNYHGFIENISGGTSTQPNMQINALLSFEIKLPPLPEQKAIAAVLSSLDDKIDLLHRQNKTLEALAETLFRQWFMEEAREDWEEGTLSDVIEIYDSKRVPLSKMQRDKMKSGKLYPYYGAAQIMDYINDYIFDGEYILLGEDGTVRTDDGYPVMQYATGKFWVNNHTHVFQAKKPYSNFFIWNYLIKKNIDEIVTGAVQPKINQTNLKSIDFPKYPETLVIIFNEKTKPIFDKIKHNKSQIRTLEKLRDTLLPKLMSGEVRVKMSEPQMGTIK